MSHAITVEPISHSLYRVHYQGRVLLESSRCPEFDAARALLAQGLTGTLLVFRPGRSTWDLRCGIEWAARHTVEETARTGPRLRRWRPMGDAAPVRTGGPRRAIAARGPSYTGAGRSAAPRATVTPRRAISSARPRSQDL